MSAPITVKEALERLNEWAIEERPRRIDWRTEQIARATCAILDRPGNINLDAQLPEAGEFAGERGAAVQG